jgi:glycosyltransferase involved in cell wall biosynthesis
VYYFSTNRLIKVCKAFRAIRRGKPNAVYVNSFFSPLFAIVPIALWRIGFFGTGRLLIAPRGEFDEGALTIKEAKKKCYLLAFKVTGVAHKVVWHASSSIEKAAIHAVFGESACVLIRENETSLGRIPISPTGSEGALNLVFLSRITRKKGLDIVLRALKCVSMDVKLDIFGPGEDERYVAECLKIVAALPSNVEVNFMGPLVRAKVLGTLAGYNAMVFPTHGENFGHVIAEALSASCPVICSDRTPWTGVLRTGGGMVVDSASDIAWVRAIEGLAAMSPSERHRLRLSAGEAFARWRQAEKGPHVFEMLADMTDQITGEPGTLLTRMNTAEAE